MPNGNIRLSLYVSPSSQDALVQRPQPIFNRLAAAASRQFGSKTNTQPITEEAQVAKVGSHQHGFAFRDFYNRFHVTPRKFDLGNLFTSQTRQVRVWNAHLVPRTLNEIETVGGNGITLDGLSPPTAYAALQQRTYDLNISTSGPPVVDATYTFVFSTGEVVAVEITGRRLVIWPFVPQHGVTERLAWKTDVMPTASTEQRHALRRRPRRTYETEQWLTHREYSVAKAIASGWAHRLYGFPVWHELTKILGLSAGTVMIPLDAANLGFAAGATAIVWESSDKFEVMDVQAVATDSITLELPLVNNYTVAYVMPLDVGRLTRPVEAQRGQDERIILGTEFESSQAPDAVGASGLPTYATLDVMTDTMMIVGDYREKVIREVDTLDNGVSRPYQDPLQNFSVQGSTLSWAPKTREELWRIRAWLYARKGRQKSFWLPSKLKDLTPVFDIPNGANGFAIENIGYSLYYGVKYICIKLKTGEMYFNKILSGSLRTDGAEDVSLQTPVPVAMPRSNIEYICFMYQMRLDADVVEISHSVSGATISVPVVEVPV